MLFLAGATAGVAYMVKPAIDRIFFNKDLRMLTLIPPVIIILYLLKGIFDYGQSYLMGYVGHRAVTDIRDAIYAHLQTLSLSFFTRVPTGVLMSRIANDTNLLQRTVSDVVTSVLRDAFTIIGLTGVIFYQDWRLALISFFIIPWAIIPIVRFGRKSRKFSTRSQVKMGHIASFLYETISGIRIVKAFGMEAYETRRFAEENYRLFRIRMKKLRIHALASPVMEMVGCIAASAIILYGGYNVIEGNSTPGSFFSFMAAFAMLYKPVRQLNRANQVLQEGLAAAIRTFEVLDTPQEVEEKPGASALALIQEKIEFENVYFKYEDDVILKGIDLRVKAGEIIAIAGTSGAGKSTLVNLIPRLYDVTSGRVLIDGVDVRDVTVESLRKQIAIVTQETILFNDTVRNNIAYGSLERPEEEVVSAAKAADAHDFITALPLGYDSVIGERGTKLSGGQKQRIAIARALLKNAPILILDEATSNLDSRSEEEVQKALERLMEHRTTFVIAHRLSAIKNAHRIVVLAEGEAVEQGTHQELLKARGEYRRLYEMQLHPAEGATLHQLLQTAEAADN
jgi:subfamily B ATP-binding cassette protein MsbA